MARRTNTAAWVESRGRWQINVQKDGQRRTFTSSKPGRTGQREANAKADAWLDDGLVSQNVKVSLLWAQFIEHQKTVAGPSSIKQLQSYGSNYILPVIGHLRVDKLTEAKLQQAIDQSYQHHSLKPPDERHAFGSAPLSKKTLQNIAAIEKQFVKYLRRTLHVTTLDPELTIPSSARSQQKLILQPNTLRVLFSSDRTVWRGKTVADDFIHAYRLQVVLGLRPGELVGLQVGDLQPNAAAPSRLCIRRSIDIYGNTTQGKNQNALRDITLPPIATRILQDQLQLLRSQGIPLNYTTSLFQINTQSGYRKRWYCYQIANGIADPRPVTLYELRHTFVSIAKYLPAGQVKLLVGHSAAMDTFGQYSHAINCETEQLAQDVNSLFSKLLAT